MKAQLILSLAKYILINLKNNKDSKFIYATNDKNKTLYFEKHPFFI